MGVKVALDRDGAVLALRDGVGTPSGNTGRVYQIRYDEQIVVVRVATGKQAGSLRRFRPSSLRKL